MTINRAVATADTMTSQNMQTKESNRPEQAKPEQERQQAQHRQASATQPGQRVTPGRRPLFRTEGVSGPKLNLFIGQNRFPALGSE
jgi:hypothetical protein